MRLGMYKVFLFIHHCIIVIFINAFILTCVDFKICIFVAEKPSLGSVNNVCILLYNLY